MQRKEGILHVTFGGWYQRTTLHLTEVFDFLARGKSNLPLSSTKLKTLQKSLDIHSISREAAYLEYVHVITNNGIEIKYYEDGLYILQAQLHERNIQQTEKILRNYFEKVFSPAIAYIFSLGAPTPKVLANIKTSHPTVMGVISKNHRNYKINESKFGHTYSKIASKAYTLYKTPKYIFIVTSPAQAKNLPTLIEMQIFFREFKDQLEKYLAIHRKIWEEIADIKEKHAVRGNEVEKLQAKLNGYQKTINLITNRINQMSSYAKTREKIAKSLKIDDDLVNLFQYKFETLFDTLAYIKEIWRMTQNYVDAAIKTMADISRKTTGSTIKSIQLIASVGVISGLLRYLTADAYPSVSETGVIYFIILVLAAWTINFIITTIYKNIKYKLKFTSRATDI